MKLFLKILLTVVIALAGIIGLLYAKPNLLAKSVKYVAQRALSSDEIAAKIGEVKLSRESAVFTNITIRQNDKQIAQVESATLTYDISRIVRKMMFACDLNIINFIMDDMQFNATGSLAYSRSKQKLENFKMNFAKGGHLEFSGIYKKFLGKPYSIAASGQATDMPLMLHKAFWGLAPDNDIVIFLKDYINNGLLSGSWNVKLDRSFFGDYQVSPESLSGVFKLTEVEIKHDPDFPPLQHINADATMKGTALNFDISHGYSGGVAIYEGRVALDWKDGAYSEVVINAKGKGPALDLISFIPKTSLQDLQKSSIDLTKLSGQVDIDFGMTIPLHPTIRNSYDAKADLSNVNLKVFDGNVELSGANLKGMFDGKMVRIDGKGKINGFESDLGYQFNFDKKAEFDNMLDMKLKFAPVPGQKNANFSASSGQSIINIGYKSKDGKGHLSADSNLKNVSFFIEKLGVYKEKGDKAMLQIDSAGEGSMPSVLNIKVTGDNGLKIIGSLNISDKEKRLRLQEVKNFETDIKADIIFGDHLLKANISGKRLDLSKADMNNFLSKNSEGQSTDLQVEISRIKMKNDVWLDDFVMKVRCDKQKCYDGTMDSKIGTKAFTMNLNNEGEREEWYINTTNAGALLKALGMYYNMRGGSLMVVLGATRQQVKAGEQIDIIKGRFTLQKFMTTKTPILTRMVSFISLPGLLSAITNNQTLAFKEMNGIFSCKNNKIIIDQANAEGPFFDFTMKGSIDTIDRTINLKGRVTPSLYGINTLVNHIPIIGKILSGGHRKGLISAPYVVKSKY